MATMTVHWIAAVTPYRGDFDLPDRSPSLDTDLWFSIDPWAAAD